MSSYEQTLQDVRADGSLFRMVKDVTRLPWFDHHQKLAKCIIWVGEWMVHQNTDKQKEWPSYSRPEDGMRIASLMTLMIAHGFLQKDGVSDVISYTPLGRKYMEMVTYGEPSFRAQLDNMWREASNDVRMKFVLDHIDGFAEKMKAAPSYAHMDILAKEFHWMVGRLELKQSAAEEIAVKFRVEEGSP